MILSQRPHVNNPSASTELDVLRYRVIAELMNGSVHEYRVTPGGEFILEWAVGTENTFGVSASELQRRDSNSFLHSEDRAAVAAHMQACLRGENLDFSTRIMRPDGEVRWLRVANRPLRDGPTGRVSKMIGICIDVTEQQRASQALHDSEARYRMIADLSRDYVFEAGIDSTGTTQIEWWNARASQFFGCDLDEFNRLGWRYFVLPQFAAQGELRRNRTLRGEPTWDEIPVRTLRGELRRIELRTKPILAADGVVQRYIGVARDITERRADEERLRSEAHAFQMMREGVVLTNGQGIIRVTNPAFAAWFGRTPEQLVGTFVGDLPSEPRMRALGNDMRQAMVGSAPLRRIIRVPDGALDTRTVEATITPITLREEPFWLTVMHDITVRQELEREVLEISNREQQRIGGDLHDGLGQELTGIALLLRGLANKADRQAPALAPAIAEVARLVNDAIFTTRSLARGLTPVTFDRGGLSHAVADLARRSLGVFGVRVQCQMDANIERSLSESTALHLYRMIQEGIANAAKHAQAQNIDVGLARRGDRCELTIADDGHGIELGPESDGQGLKIMRYRAGIIAGSLSVETQRGRGTRITCEFPLLSPGDVS